MKPAPAQKSALFASFCLFAATFITALSHQALAQVAHGTCTCNMGCELFSGSCSFPAGDSCNPGFHPLCDYGSGGMCGKTEYCDGMCTCVTDITGSSSSSGGGSSSSSGSSSGGPVDSGNDSAAIESGAPESGPLEASTPEASAPETGVPEASPPETGGPETGPVDASGDMFSPIDATPEASLYSDATPPPPVPDASCVCPSGAACTGCAGIQNFCAVPCGAGEFPCPGGGLCTQGLCIPMCCVAGCSGTDVCDPIRGECTGGDSGSLSNPGDAAAPTGSSSDADLADATGDSGTPGGATGSSSGCGCIVVDGSDSGAIALGFSAAFGALLLSRRRRHP